MERLTKYFRVNFTEAKMIAQIECTKEFLEMEEEFLVSEDLWKQYFAAEKVTHGLNFEVVQELIAAPSKQEYPLTIATGQLPERGKDGRVEYIFNYDPQINREKNWNFRDVMRIPSVSKGQKLAKIISPTLGEEGINVSGQRVKPIAGTPAIIRAGKNVIFKKDNNCLYAVEDGQFTLSGRRLNVYPEYEVHESLSLKDGNLDFIGTIIIHGDVPAGFRVKAEGDVKIFGMVEAAEIIAGGSIYIAEGIAGQKKGYLRAENNVRIGYINQAEVYAGTDLYVENSIIHSKCVVNGHVFCQKGNLIGGSLSAGKSIDANDIGTKMNTVTEVILGVNKLISDEEQKLKNEKIELEAVLEKLQLLGEKLSQQDPSNPKIRISLLRQRNSYEKTIEQLNDVKNELSLLNSELGNVEETRLIVRNFIYQNAVVTFGKYTHVMKSNYHYVQMKTEGNEIALQQLY